MTAARLLTRLRGMGVQVWADGDMLRFRAPKGLVTPELKEEMRRYKPDLLELLERRLSTVELYGLLLRPCTECAHLGPGGCAKGRERASYVVPCICADFDPIRERRTANG